MNLTINDTFLILSSSLELQRFKIFIKKLYDKNILLEILKHDTEQYAALSLFDKERIDFIRKELKQISIDQVKNDLAIEKVNFITLADEKYPKQLKEINDPPLVLFYRGNLDLFNNLSVAIVGTRNPTNYGIRITKKISEAISNKNLIIISGLASGIDSCAHKESIKSSKTIAILGTGLDEIYPVENRELFNNILETGGLIISEYPIGTTGMPWNFPQRNRIISALSSAVIVIEGNLQSGSLITARFAIKQNKPLFALPGHIDSPESNGPNMLIKSKAAELLTSVEDVLEKISEVNTSGIQIKMDFRDKKNIPDDLTEIQKNIYLILDKTSLTFDSLIKEISISQGELLRNLSMLELKGYIAKKLNGEYEAIDN